MSCEDAYDVILRILESTSVGIATNVGISSIPITNAMINPIKSLRNSLLDICQMPHEEYMDIADLMERTLRREYYEL